MSFWNSSCIRFNGARSCQFGCLRYDEYANLNKLHVIITFPEKSAPLEKIVGVGKNNKFGYRHICGQQMNIHTTYSTLMSLPCQIRAVTSWWEILLVYAVVIVGLFLRISWMTHDSIPKIF